MKKKGSFLGLVPLLIFLLIYASTGIFTDKIDNMPLLVAFTITVAIALCFNNPNKEKISFEQKVEIFCKGASDSTLLLLVIIFLLAGAFYSVADAMGAVKSMVNLGLTLLPLKMLLPGLFIIGCILSFAMGTSMGTVSALTPIAVGIANETGISLPLICGVVVGGAMFGDNLSFISDTTIAATRTQEVEMKDKFKVNFLIVLPAVILNIIVLSFIGGEGIQGAVYEYSLLNLVPYVSIIVLALIGINVIIVLTIGVVLGLIIGLINNSFTFIEIFSVVQRGMGWMENMAIIALVVGGVVAIMEYLGGVDYLLENLELFVSVAENNAELWKFDKHIKETENLRRKMNQVIQLIRDDHEEYMKFLLNVILETGGLFTAIVTNVEKAAKLHDDITHNFMDDAVKLGRALKKIEAERQSDINKKTKKNYSEKEEDPIK